MATICDIAKRAKVAPATVSNVLNGRNKGVYGGAIARRAQQIFAIAEELGYRPNHAARSIQSNRSGIIALLVWEVDNPSTGKLVKLFEQALHKLGYRILLGITGGDKDSDKYLRQFPVGMVDGVINADPFLSHEQVLKCLAPMPVVTHNRDESSPAQTNVAQSTRLVMEHLFALGHRRIGMLHGVSWDISDRIMLATYHSCLAEQGIEAEASWLGEESYSNGDLTGPLALERVRAGCTAIVLGNDYSALRAISALESSGLRVPQDVSVAGRGDSELTMFGPPKLTTIQHPLHGLVQAHVDTIVALVNDQPVPRPVLLDSVLLIRQTTAQCAASCNSVGLNTPSAMSRDISVPAPATDTGKVKTQVRPKTSRKKSTCPGVNALEPCL